MDKETFGRILAKRLLEASDALASWPVPDGQPDKNIRLQLNNSIWQAALSAGQMGGVTIRQAREVEPAPCVTLRTARLMAGKGYLMAKQFEESNGRLLEELAACRDLIAEMTTHAGTHSPDMALALIAKHKLDSEKLTQLRKEDLIKTRSCLGIEVKDQK